MRDHLFIYVNGHRHELRGADVFQSLSDFLRNQLHLTGTKIVCSEGDCGACTVHLGRPNSDGSLIDYQIVNSCIQFLWQLDCTHIITIEGLRTSAELTPLQERMVSCHASQCGFCTPGFVMSLSALCQPGKRVTEPEVREALTGNLCRCTGYLPILQAATTLDCASMTSLQDLYPSAEIAREMHSRQRDTVICRAGDRLMCKPADLKQAAAFLVEHPEALLFAGGTDLGVRTNKGMLTPKTILAIGDLAELREIKLTDTHLSAGAMTTWSRIEAVAAENVPELHQIMLLFGSPQIRNAGTIGGNIANASPIADSLPFLYVSEAEVDLAGPAGLRSVAIDRFYKGYKSLDLQPGELIAGIRIPLPAPDRILKLYKVSKRKHLDIATFTAAISMRMKGAIIEEPRLAFGGVGPTVLRLRETEAFLAGKEFTERTLREAGELASAEVTPISDVRAGKQYRSLLARNILLKFFHDRADLAPPAETLSVN